MQYTRREHERFLDEELLTISDKYVQLIRRSALALMEQGEIFLSQFIKIDEDGCAILKMRNSRGLPRKGDYFCATLLIGEMAKYRNWGNISWADLRKRYQKEFSDVVCVWLGKTEDPEFSFVGIKGVSLDLARELVTGCILVLGPQEPPIAYYKNLITIIRQEPDNTAVGKMLDYSALPINWNPIKIGAEESSGSYFSGQLSLSDYIIVQGPPGTGKTYKMADLICKLPKGSSVLVTALTNRALMELAGKDILKPMLDECKIYKTSLTSDEQRELPKLQPIVGKDVHCMPGCLTLATFYASSYWAAKDCEEPLFDYVIMDEASQAFFAMICAGRKLGKKVIWIGDQCQMPPIINMDIDRMNQRNWFGLAAGFKTLCDYFSYPSFFLNESYRLSERACRYTGVFYDNSLNSVSGIQSGIKLPSLHPLGGPSLFSLDLPLGDRCPVEMTQTVTGLLQELLGINPKMQIAVLTKFRSTVKILQRAFVSCFGEKNNVLIDTVERVQGLTCDVCIFCIPNDLVYMSLEKTFFNVATSRARYNTIIVSDKNLVSSIEMNSPVKKYMSLLIGDK